ncbi:MAG: SDR family oxidoreductase [Novosphingobium sp.]
MDISAARHAFITGGASGLGLAIGDALAARGLKVTIADVQSSLLDEVLAARGENWRGVLLDVRDRDGWAKAKAEAEAAFGPVDVLVNNAGIAPNGKPFADMPPESFDQIIAINLVGVFNGVQAFGADMRERGRGHIVNTSSMAGLAASTPGTGAYATAKFGVTAMSELLRAEMAPHGVGVTVLCPGFVVTGLGANTARLGGLTRGLPPGAPMPKTDVTSEHVADMVVQAIENDESHVVTHGGSWREIEKRFSAIKAACDLADARGLGGR